MKTLWLIIATAFVVILIFAAALAAFFITKGRALDVQSKAYVDRNLPLIFTAWDERALLRHTSPEFTNKVTRAELDWEFTNLSRKLGKMNAYQGCAGQCKVNFSPGSRRIITAAYTAKVVYDKGPATITIALIKHGDFWQITGFGVNSSMLVQNR